MRLKYIGLFIATITLLSAGCEKSLPAQNIPVENNTPTPTVSKTIFVRDIPLQIQFADTPELRRKGLSGSQPLTTSQGMLFDFTNSPDRRPAFWMKDMLFNIDIIWIKDNKVFAVTKNVFAPSSSSSELPTYQPPSEIDYVLEVIAGWSDKNYVRIGDPILIK